MGGTRGQDDFRVLLHHSRCLIHRRGQEDGVFGVLQHLSRITSSEEGRGVGRREEERFSSFTAGSYKKAVRHVVQGNVISWYKIAVRNLLTGKMVHVVWVRV